MAQTPVSSAIAIRTPVSDLRLITCGCMRWRITLVEDEEIEAWFMVVLVQYGVARETWAALLQPRSKMAPKDSGEWTFS